MKNIDNTGKLDPDTEQALSTWVTEFIERGLTDGIVPPNGTIDITLSDRRNLALHIKGGLTIMQQPEGTEAGYTVTDLDYELIPLAGLLGGHPQR